MSPPPSLGNASPPTNRPRRRRRRRLPSYPLKIAGVVVCGMGVAWVAFTLLAKIAHPYLLGHAEGKKVAELQLRLTRQNAQNDALERRIKYLRTPEGAESAARHAGYHRHGEMVYLIDGKILDSKGAAHDAPKP